MELKDGEGTARVAGVTETHALKVAVVEQSALAISVSELTRYKQFRGFLTNGGSEDMTVDGSSTPQVFEQAAEEERVIWVTAVRLLFNGSNMEMDTNDFRRFGDATASNTPLTNGVELFITQSGVETALYASAVTRMGDFYDYADDSLNIKNSIDTSSDFLYFDFKFDVPVVLPAGSADRIGVRVQDDLTPLDRFVGITRGYQEVGT